MRGTTDLATQIDNYLRKKGSPLAGYGRTFVQAGKKYGVDPRAIVAISGGETSFGTYGPAQKIHNAWGWGPHIPFSSWEQGINTVTKGLASGYVGQGLDTFPEIQRKWAPIGAGNDPTGLNNNWIKTNSQFARELGLDPNKSIKYGAQLGGQAAPVTGESPVTGVPTTGATPKDIPNPAGALDLNRIFGIMNAQGKRALQGQMPSPNYVREMLKLVGQAVPRAGQGLPTGGQPTTPSRPSGGGTPAAPGQIKPGGGWGGSEGVIKSVALPALKGTGVQITSQKRSNPSPVAGTASDHYEGNKNAFAFDMSDGSNPTPGMDLVASRIVASLGGPKNWGKTGGNFKKVITTADGRKWAVQVIYRSQVGGNHDNHVHFGAHLVG